MSLTAVIGRVSSAATLCAAALSAGIFFSSEAQAQSEICEALKLELSSLNTRANLGSNSKKYRQYTDAIRKQQNQISKANRIANRAGCLRRGIFRNRSAQCRRVVSSLQKMEANLIELRAARDEFAPQQVGDTQKRRQVLALLERNGCQIDGRTVRSRNASIRDTRNSRRRSLIEQIFGVRTYRDDGNYRENDIYSTYGANATFRTLCVRKLDGYYFPISFSTTRDRFERDDAVCREMCPGTDVGLYFHAMPGQDSEEMISFLTDRPYKDEPFAFAYRQSVNTEARCRFAVREDIRTARRLGTVTDYPVATPIFAMDRILSPDDQDIISGGLSIDLATTMLKEAREPKDSDGGAVADNGRRVRIVGPAFFPVQ